MRRLVAILGMLLVACSDQGPSFIGHYELRSIRNDPLPFTSSDGQVTVIRGAIEIQGGNRYSGYAVLLPAGSEIDTVYDSGEWRVDEGSPDVIALSGGGSLFPPLGHWEGDKSAIIFTLPEGIWRYER